MSTMISKTVYRDPVSHPLAGFAAFFQSLQLCLPINALAVNMHAHFPDSMLVCAQSAETLYLTAPKLTATIVKYGKNPKRNG